MKAGSKKVFIDANKDTSIVLDPEILSSLNEGSIFYKARMIARMAAKQCNLSPPTEILVFSILKAALCNVVQKEVAAKVEFDTLSGKLVFEKCYKGFLVSWRSDKHEFEKEESEKLIDFFKQF